MAPPPTTPATFRAAPDSLPGDMGAPVLMLPRKSTCCLGNPFRKKRAGRPSFQLCGPIHQATIPSIDILRGAMASRVCGYSYDIAFWSWAILAPHPRADFCAPPPLQEGVVAGSSVSHHSKRASLYLFESVQKGRWVSGALRGHFMR